MSVFRSRVVLATLLVLSCLPAHDTPSRDALIVYGDRWAFSVSEPLGWHGDTERATQWGANVIFYRDSMALDSGSGLIRVLVADKADENTAEDLESDMAGYRRAYPGTEFWRLDVSHPQYAVFAKIFASPGRSYEYVTYLNPGPASQRLFSVAYNSFRAPASTAELRAYRAVVASLSVMR